MILFSRPVWSCDDLDSNVEQPVNRPTLIINLSTENSNTFNIETSSNQTHKSKKQTHKPINHRNQTHKKPRKNIQKKKKTTNKPRISRKNHHNYYNLSTYLNRKLAITKYSFTFIHTRFINPRLTTNIYETKLNILDPNPPSTTSPRRSNPFPKVGLFIYLF